MLSSINNGQIKNLIQLQKRAKTRRDQGLFIVEGEKMCLEAIDLGVIKKIYITETFYKEKVESNHFSLSGTEYEVVSDMLFAQVSDTITPQGVLAIVEMPSYEIGDILEDPSANLLVLENVRDPGNLGTIVRTAEGAGITGIIMSKETVDIFNPKVIRATMGSVYRVPFVYVEAFHQTLGLLKSNGIALYATHLRGTKDYTGENYCEKCAIIIGNEANGITESTAQQVEHLIRIPMEGKVESLNAGIAAGIVMYEVYRQRRI